jgi:hypothetical protein
MGLVQRLERAGRRLRAAISGQEWGFQGRCNGRSWLRCQRRRPGGRSGLVLGRSKAGCAKRMGGFFVVGNFYRVLAITIKTPCDFLALHFRA